MIPGGVELRVHEFVMKQLDHSQFVPADEAGARIEPLTVSTARMLDIGASALIRRGLAAAPPSLSWQPGAGTFAALSRIDRLRTIALLNRLEVPDRDLPFPYAGNPGLVQTMMDSLHQLSMFGYYSEWYGYGTTRLLPPEQQRVEFFPPGWRFAGYPGPAFGYRAYRGTILRDPSRKEEGWNGQS